MQWRAVSLIVGLFCRGPHRRTLLSRFRHDVIGEEIIVGVERRVLFDCIAESAVAVGAQATPTSRPHLVGVAEVLHCAGCPFSRRLAPPCFIHGQAVEGVVKDGAGKRGARLRLDAALEAAEDGHVARLQVRRALWLEEGKHDVRECGPHGYQCGLAGVDAGHVPSLLGFSTVSRAAASCRIVNGGLPRVALQLSLLHAAAAPSGLVHRQEAARGLVDVDDTVCADSVLLHESAKLDEGAVRVGLLQSRAVELLQALGRFLEAQAHAMQELSDPLSTGAHVETRCVEPLVDQASDGHRTQAQDVGHLHEVLAQSRRVCGRQHASPAARLCLWRAPLPAVGNVLVDAVEHSGAQTLDLA